MDAALPQHVESHYAAMVGGPQERPRLTGEERCEVTVIGGGLTGVSTALNLAEAGIDVVLIEAARIGWGASGRNGGQAQTGFGGEMEDLERLVDDETVRALWELSVRGLDIVVERCRKHRIACDLTPGYLLAAAKPRNMEHHAAWVDRAERVYGYTKFKLLDRAAVRREVATDRYHGGILDGGSWHLNPLKYCLGLADAAEKAGAHIFEGSRAVDVAFEPRPVVHTEHGTIRADKLVIACNAFPTAFDPSMSRRIMPVGTYICATEPLGAERARGLIPNNIAVCDDRHVLDYFRLSTDGRMLFGGRETVTGRAPRNLAAALRRRMLRVFPQLADVEVDTVWGGQIALTRNRFPDIGRCHPNVYYAQGFSGHGLAMSGVAGEIIAQAIKNDHRGLDIFERIPHRPFPGGATVRVPIAWLALLWLKLKDIV